MKRTKSLSVEMLGKLSGKGTDEVLLVLWDSGMDGIIDADDILVGQKLLQAKNILGIPGATHLTSLGYWESVFGISEQELRCLLKSLNFHMSEKARKLPSGAIKKLKGEAKKRNTILQNVKPKAEVASEEVSFDTIEWRTIGKKEDEFTGIDIKEILGIHYSLVKDFDRHIDPINPAGPRDINLIESALYRQETCAGLHSKYESIEMRGAALLHSLIHNHPFHNGNKRTALVSLLVFLDKNQMMLTCSQDELFKFVLNVAQHRIVKDKYFDLADREVIAIAEWIFANSRNVKLGDRVFPFRRVKQILNRYNCEISHSGSGTNYKVTRKVKGETIFRRSRVLTTNISARNEGCDLLVRTIKKIRQDLELDEEHGIDSAAFYEQLPTPIDEFIVRYRKTLNRLAKL